MRHLPAIILFTVVIPLHAFAQVEEDYMIALFADSTHAVYSICDFEQGHIAMSEYWIMVKPNTNGIQAAAFSISYPSNACPNGSFISNNSLGTVSLGDLTSGIEVAFSCIYDWGWIIKQEFWITTSGETAITINPNTNFYQDIIFISCEDAMGSFDYILPLLLNIDGWECTEPIETVANSVSSWGTIKRLFTD